MSYRVKLWGVNYISPETILEVLDIESDYVNSYEDNSHLNFYGATKFTTFIGNYIKENYDVPDRRDNPAYATWNTYYTQYLQWLD